MTPEQRKAWDREDYHRRRKRAIEYLGGACTDCNTTEDLQFDHKDAKSKSFDIARNMNRRWEVLKQELDKCALRCSSCHLKKTLQNGESGGGHNKWIEIQHGTLHAYTDPKYRCRCDLCVDVARKAKKRIGPRRQPAICGSYAMYKRGCRCRACKDANNAYMREFNARKRK